MPLHIDRTSRRSFLRTSLGAGVSLLTLGCLNQRRFVGWADALDSDGQRRDAQLPEQWVLMSDTHIAGDARTTSRGVNMADHLGRAVHEIVTTHRTAAGVIINGDCARRAGESDDYRTFRELAIDPLAAHDLPVHLTLGNHDHRQRFLDAFGHDTDAPIHGRMVSIIRGRYANFFLLDTLDRTGRVSGRLGAQQLTWLDASLAAHDDAPAIVVGHHPRGGDEVDFVRKLGSLRDGRGLWDVLTRHEHVQAYVYGHTHRWDVTRRDGVYLINLPATSFAFDAAQPTGWISMSLNPHGAELTFHRLGGGAIAATGAAVSLRWAAPAMPLRVVA